MSGNKRRKEVNLRKLTRNTAWIGFVVFGVASVAICIILMAACSAFLGIILQNKIESKYESIKSMRDFIERYTAEEGLPMELMYSKLDTYGMDYYFLDSDSGKVLYQNGEVETFVNDDRIAVSTNEDASFFSHSDIGLTHIGDDETAVLYLPFIFENLSVSKLWRESKVDLNATAAEYPVWVGTAIGDGKIQFFCKMSIDITFGDMIYAFIFYMIIAVILFVMFVIMIVNAVTNAVRKIRTTNLLFTDVVTRGHNWLWFVYRGNQLIRKKKNRSRTYAVVSIEMVKYANFCICHSLTEGEEMLYQISEIISKNVMKKEFCAHASGAEFALLLKYNDEERIKKRVAHIIEQLQGVCDEHKFSFQAGIAVVDIPNNGDKDRKGRLIIDIEKVYHYALAAKATLSGTDDSGVALLDDKLIEDQKWVDIVQENQQAAYDNEEFLIYYQPKYNPVTNKLSGAEALIRWQSPEFGFVTPGRIIPIFEQNGFITKIDHYMIIHVARDQKRWLDEGYNCVPVSVNVSRAHFIEADLAEQIRDMVDSEGCPHEYIEIELTESAFFDDKKMMLETIRRLKSYGFAVSMDDFGSGYSSLNSLKDMPLDVLKLDAEFFRGEQGDGRGQIVVSEAIKLARRLDMRIVAEGVEMKEQVDFLAEQGCDMIQGYYYAKPMTALDYEERMRD